MKYPESPDDIARVISEDDGSRPGGVLHDRSQELFVNSWKALKQAAHGYGGGGDPKGKELSRLLASIETQLNQVLQSGSTPPAAATPQ